MSASEILEQIRRLPREEQHELVEAIRHEFGEFDEELSPEQIAELERRAEEFRKNPKAAVPWGQVRDEARKRFVRK